MLYFNVVVSGLMNGVLFGLVSMGFGLFYWVTKVFHLAYGGVFTASAYVAYHVAVVWKLGIPIGFVVGTLFAATLGILIDSLIFQPLTNRGVDRHMLLISGLGLEAVIVTLCILKWGALLRYYPPTELDGVVQMLLPITVTWLQLLGVVGALLFFAFVTWLLRSTLVGKSARAIAADAEIAAVVGVDPRSVRMVIAAVTAAAAAWAAIFQTVTLGVHAGMGLHVLIMASSGALLGGSSLKGAFAAGVTLGVLQNVGAFIVGSQWRSSIALVILLIVLSLRTWVSVRRRRKTPTVSASSIPAR